MPKELSIYNCIIIDDEQFARELIAENLRKYPYFKILGKFKRTDLAKHLLTSDVEVDVIFLDIHMPIETGLEFLINNNITHNVIFTTAFSEYAVQSYNFNVIDYLLKPIEESRFDQAIEKLITAIEIQQKAKAYNKIENTKENFILLKSGAESQKVLFHNLLYLKSENEYINYVTYTKKHLYLGSLKSVLMQLPESFIQTHRSYIINTNKIKSRVRNSIILENNHIIPIGKTHRKEVVNMLKSKGF